MGTEVANKRDIFVGVRYTRSEYEQLKADMSSISCLSVSKYIRIRTLNQQIKVHKFAYTDKALHKQINDLSKKISVIGNNINQVVKRYHTSCNSVRKNGDPVINTKATVYYFNKLLDEIQKLKENQMQIINTVSRIEIEK